MISINLDKCVGCGTCIAFCPREALEAWWGYAEVDTEKCKDCFGGSLLFSQENILEIQASSLKNKKNEWTRLCVQYCPAEAIEAIETNRPSPSKKRLVKSRH